MTPFKSIIAAVAMAATTTVPLASVQAMPRLVERPVAQNTNDVTNIRWRRVCKRHRCRSVWTGPHRYKNRYGHHRYRHGPRVVIKPRIVIKPRHNNVRRAYGRHDRWCMARYRSYNPATNRFFGYDGRYHRCKSPFRR